MNFVYIQNGVVIDKTQIPPENVFYEPYASKFIEAPDEVTHGWIYDGEKFKEPPIMEEVTIPPPTKEDLLAQVQALTAQIQELK